LRNPAAGGQRGITLVELIIALAIIGIALLGAIQVLVGTSELKHTTREMTIAREAAAAEIERLKAQSVSNFDGLAGLNGTSASVSRLPNGILAREVITTNPNLYNVRVTVTWTGLIAR
jgi:prepilin-type N-terminal cleavage/methylation domain-containing protein